MSRHVIVGLGEVLWDVFPDEQRLGGAPANVAFHVEVLGEEGVIASRIGSDALGSELIERLSARGLRTDAIQIDPALPTGTVRVTFDELEPKFEITDNVAWDALEWNHELALLATTCDAACFSTLSQRCETTRRTIHTFLRSMKPGTLRVLDVNLRPPFVDQEIIRESIEAADVIKYNRAERSVIGKMFGVEDVESWLLSDMDVKLVVETRGPDGCALFTETERVEKDGIEVDTSDGDAVGVGDAFIATVIHELLREASLERIANFANRYAAIVAKKKGGMPA
jgi:fructokinase